VTAPEGRRSLRWLLLYALAYGGGVVAYVPLLTLILPVKVELLTGVEGKVGLLSAATLAGALAASFGNVGAGMLSDLTANGRWGRRPWVWAGLVATLASFALLWMASSDWTVIAAVVVFQLAVNLMIAPLIAIAADETPDEQKGLVGGLFGAAYPLGALSGVVVTGPGGAGEGTQLAMIAVMVVALAAPFLLVHRRRAPLAAATDPAAASRPSGMRNLALVWGARLLVQVAGIILFAYLLYYFQAVSPDARAGGLTASVAQLSGFAAVATVPVAIAAGRVSDVFHARKPVLLAAMAAVTASLLLMAAASGWAAAATGYALFACFSSVFLALQNTYAMQLLPSARHRGRDLGLLNLTNTLPSIIAPGIAWWVLTSGGFRPLLLLLAALSVAAAGLMLMVRDAPA
jgi:MFS family permease